MHTATNIHEKELAEALRACLDASDIDATLMQLYPSMPRLAQLAPATGRFGASEPAPLAGFCAVIFSRLFLRRGEAARVETFLNWLNDLLGPPYRRGDGAWAILLPYPALWGPLIEARIALGDQLGAMRDLNYAAKECCDGACDPRQAAPLLTDPLVADLLGHAQAKTFGPFLLEPEWLLDRADEISGLGSLDRRLAVVQAFDARFIELALQAKEPERALPLVDAQLDWYLRAPTECETHFEFNAIAVLAALGQHERAIDAAHQLARRGYGQIWRLMPDAGETHAWTRKVGQWLQPLHGLPAYGVLLDKIFPDLKLAPHATTLCVVRDAIWTGKKPVRCEIMRGKVKIQPGDPIIRYRLLFDRPDSGELLIASQAGFSASELQAARVQFENNSVPLSGLFPGSRTISARIQAPLIHAFAWDMARNPAGFDIGQAVHLIAEHEPPPLRHSWNRLILTGEHETGSERWAQAFEPLAGDDHYGDAVSLTWRLLRAGFGPALIEEVAKQDAAKADKVFAMLATFDAPDLREAAARYFDASALPETMALIFKDRPTLEDHLTIARFGSDQPRFRRAMLAAMRGYGLHLYSNRSPTADWFLQGLERYAMCGGGMLLALLLHHPDEEPILSIVIEKGWLPDTGGSGAAQDAYGNTAVFYLRMALMHLALHDRGRLDAWLEPRVSARWATMQKSRDTLRLIKQLAKLK